MESVRELTWKVLLKEKSTDIIDTLLTNRGFVTVKEKDAFLNPKKPEEITLKEVGLSKLEMNKVVKRIKKAIIAKEKIIIYGDYDADGVNATAILWEAINSQKGDVFPYLPERFSEGYGLNAESVAKLKKEYPNLGLIITVDNGITALPAVKAVNKLGIDVIVTDHHQPGKKLPESFATLHTLETSGAGIAWFLARELGVSSGLELACIGIIADQIPLLALNRSLVKYGLKQLGKTKRPGLLALFKEASVKEDGVNPYSVGFLIAPRINAMGRMSHAIDALRLVCTKSPARADELARLLGKTNKERQHAVEGVILQARTVVKSRTEDGFILIAHEDYHEGVIGLIAGKLVEEFYRPVIVIAKGKEISKGSARSIPGINIIKVIREMEDLLLGGGGHAMAAGFSIKTSDLPKFEKKLAKLSKTYLNEKVLKKSLKVDMELEFSEINMTVAKKLQQFEPFGTDNQSPIFMTQKAKVVGARLIGKNTDHLKLKLNKNDKFFEAVGFNMGENFQKLSKDQEIDVAYGIEENIWNGITNLQLKIKDLRL